MDIIISLECTSAKSRPKTLNWALVKDFRTLTAERRRWYMAAETAWKRARSKEGGFSFNRKALFVLEYVTPGKLGDADNMAFISKAILDAALCPAAVGHTTGIAKIHGAGLLKDDSPKYLSGIVLASPRHPHEYESKNAKVIATLTDNIKYTAFMYALQYGA